MQVSKIPILLILEENITRIQSKHEEDSTVVYDAVQGFSSVTESFGAIYFLLLCIQFLKTNWLQFSTECFQLHIGDEELCTTLSFS